MQTICDSIRKVTLLTKRDRDRVGKVGGAGAGDEVAVPALELECCAGEDGGVQACGHTKVDGLFVIAVEVDLASRVEAAEADGIGADAQVAAREGRLLFEGAVEEVRELAGGRVAEGKCKVVEVHAFASDLA